MAKKTPKEEIGSKVREFQKLIYKVEDAANAFDVSWAATQLSNELDKLIGLQDKLTEMERDRDYWLKKHEKLELSVNKEHEKQIKNAAKDFGKLCLRNEQLVVENNMLKGDIKKLQETLSTFKFIKASITVSPTKK